MQSGARAQLVLLLQRLHQVFLKVENRSHEYIATIASQWMQGHSYEEFIKYKWEKKLAEVEAKRLSNKRGVRAPDLSSIIRAVFVEIENNLRFTYVKYSKCYMDLLKYALIEADFNDVAARLVPIPLYLELGASSVTMVNLIGLGLSRVCAAVIADEAPSASMTRLELIAWLRRTKLADRGVSPVVLREIAGLISA